MNSELRTVNGQGTADGERGTGNSGRVNGEQRTGNRDWRAVSSGGGRKLLTKNFFVGPELNRMAGIRPHYKLEAWKEAMALVSVIYRVTQDFPKDEIFGLTAQLRRAAVSVPSNIAEGAARHGPKEFAQFLNIAIGSISEIETQLLIAVDLGYLARDASVFALLERVSKLASGLSKRVRQ